jgi:hypothetical protein
LSVCCSAEFASKVDYVLRVSLAVGRHYRRCRAGLEKDVRRAANIPQHYCKARILSDELAARCCEIPWHTVGHGKNVLPLQQIEALLSAFQIPFKVTVKEANLGRPIPQKVKDTMLQCGSAILIFTNDEKFFDADGAELWRPSENVCGAA